MFFWLKKRDYEGFNDKVSKINKSLERSFLNVKTDITHVITKVDKLKEDHKTRDDELLRIHKRIDELELLFNSTLNFRVEKGGVFGQLFEHKRTDNCLDQSTVVVQTKKMGDKWTKNLTPMERAIIHILLNSDLKLCYDDLSVIIGRDKSTIRGQVNNIKQKTENLIYEYIEKNGKKRFYIDDKVKNEVLKERRNLVKGPVISRK